MQFAFTQIALERLKAQGEHYDSTTPAFGIRVGKNRKTFFVIRGKQRLRKTIGRFPMTPLADARKEAKRLLTEPVTKQGRVRFSEANDEFKKHIAVRNKPRTQADYKRILSKYFEPPLGTKRLTDLTYEDVVACVKGAAKGEATKALAVARAFLRWCTRPPRRYMPHSPLEGLQLAPNGRRKRVLTPEELRTVWDAAKAQGYPHGTVVMLLILLGQRKGEIANLRRAWINEKERTITLPEWLTKNSKEHTIPYGQMAQDIFDTIPRFNSTDLLFPSRVSGDRPISGWSKFKKEMLEDIEIAQFGLHDLRRTFRTLHGKVGTPSEVGERLINHASAVASEVELIYNLHTYIPQMRLAMDAYERHLKSVLGLA